MNNLQLLAHAGEHHESTAEAVQHAANSGIIISEALLFWLTLIIVPALLFGIMQLLKWSLPIKLLVISTFLIIYSIVSYQNPGIYSAVALSVGFGIVLLQTILGLSATEE